MDTRDEALCKIAIDALRAIQRNATNRNSDRWQFAISRIRQTQVDIDVEEEMRAPIRPPPARSAP